MTSENVRWLFWPEEFHFGKHTYDITAAKFILSKKPRPIKPLVLADFASKVGRKGAPGLIRIDWRKALKTNTDTTPVIVVQVDGELLPIDGWHRIAKALSSGVETLPCVLLTVAETKKVIRR